MVDWWKNSQKYVTNVKVKHTTMQYCNALIVNIGFTIIVLDCQSTLQQAQKTPTEDILVGECVDIPEEFWEEDISLNPPGKRTNEAPNTNNKEIENKKKYEVITENLRKELQETEKFVNQKIETSNYYKNTNRNCRMKKKLQLKQNKTRRKQNI